MRVRTLSCTVVAAGRVYPPGVEFDASDRERDHLLAQGIVLEDVEARDPLPPPTTETHPQGDVEPLTLEQRVAAAESKDAVAAIAAELGLTLTETKLAKMRAQLLALAKPSEG